MPSCHCSQAYAAIGVVNNFRSYRARLQLTAFAVSDCFEPSAVNGRPFQVERPRCTSCIAGTLVQCVHEAAAHKEARTRRTANAHTMRV
eukprot:17845-Heterococcus_DN1.PRE.3